MDHGGYRDIGEVVWGSIQKALRISFFFLFFLRWEFWCQWGFLIARAYWKEKKKKNINIYILFFFYFKIHSFNRAVLDALEFFIFLEIDPFFLKYSIKYRSQLSYFQHKKHAIERLSHAAWLYVNFATTDHSPHLRTAAHHTLPDMSPESSEAPSSVPVAPQ